MAHVQPMISRTATPSDASRTITLTAPDTDVEGGDGTLRLRGSPSPARRGPRVAWGDDVVDNEGCGRKSSKVCCIYHKQRGFDESESEDSSDSDSDDSSSDEGEGGEPEGKGDDGRGHHDHDHHHHQHAHRHKRKEEKNAYERMPRAREKGKTPGVNQV